jgi:hypothetical protein
VAAIVYFVLTGQLPFAGHTGTQVLARQLTGTLDLSAFDAPLAEWLRNGLAREPEHRFADATEMLVAWRRAIDAIEQGADAKQNAAAHAWWRWLIPGA